MDFPLRIMALQISTPVSPCKVFFSTVSLSNTTLIIAPLILYLAGALYMISTLHTREAGIVFSKPTN